MSTDDPIHKAASLAAWGALRQRHYATVDEVFDALASDVVAAVRPLIEADRGECICGTPNDPAEDCPQHGRPYSDWVGAVDELVKKVGRLNGEITRLIDKATADRQRAAVEALREAADALPYGHVNRESLRELAAAKEAGR